MSFHDSCSDDDVDGDHYFNLTVTPDNSCLLETLADDDDVATTPKCGSTVMMQQQKRQKRRSRQNGSFPVAAERLSMLPDTNHSFTPLFDEFTDVDRFTDTQRGSCGGGFDSPSIESLTLNPLPSEMDSFTSCYTSAASNEDINASPDEQQEVRAAYPMSKAVSSSTPKRSFMSWADGSTKTDLAGNVTPSAHRQIEGTSKSPSQVAEGESIFSEDLIATEFVPDDDSETLPGLLQGRLPVSRESEPADTRGGAFLSHMVGGCYSCSDLHNQQHVVQLWYASKTRAKALWKNAMHALVVFFDRDDEHERERHAGAFSYSYDYSETPATEISRYTYTSSEDDGASFEEFDDDDDDDDDEEEEDDGEVSRASRSHQSGSGRRDEAHSDESLLRGNDALPSTGRPAVHRLAHDMDPVYKVNDGVKKLFGETAERFRQSELQLFDRATDRFAC